MVPVYGIDLGTTTSAASLYFPATESKKADVSIIRLGKQGDTIPSVVCRSSTQIWKAGENAVTEADKDRANTPVISRAKRLVGVQYADVSDAVLKQMPLVREGKGDLNGRPVFVLGKTTRSLLPLLAMFCDGCKCLAILSNICQVSASLNAAVKSHGPQITIGDG
jgi:molecular chaperone DnaK (HSP70)